MMSNLQIRSGAIATHVLDRPEKLNALNYALIDACHKLGIEYVSFRHEQQAAHAADAYGTGARRFADAAALLQALGRHNSAAPHVVSMLVKGSRFMKMEIVVAALVAPAAH